MVPLRKQVVKFCESCGRQFSACLSASKTRRYCSRRCFFNGRMRETTVTNDCAYCGSPFKIKSHLSNRKKFCSRNCYHASTLGKRPPNYKGPRLIDSGYVYIEVPDRPKKVREHRYLMEQMIGRPLGDNEHVHHIDGDSLNNDPENLQLITASEHASLHHRVESWSRLYDSCQVCGTTERKHGAHGLCSRCYTRWRLDIDPRNYRT